MRVGVSDMNGEWMSEVNSRERMEEEEGRGEGKVGISVGILASEGFRAYCI